jgi:hypothetical protein
MSNKRLAVLLRILQVTGSSIGQETGSPDGDSSLFYSVYPLKGRDKTLNQVVTASFNILSSFTVHVWPCWCACGQLQQKQEMNSCKEQVMGLQHMLCKGAAVGANVCLRRPLEAKGKGIRRLGGGGATGREACAVRAMNVTSQRLYSVPRFLSSYFGNVFGVRVIRVYSSTRELIT